MGNRVYITLNKKTYYTHWNGGLDSFCPLIEALEQITNEAKIILSDEMIVESWFKFCGQKLELQKSPEAKNWTEENGHYFIEYSPLGLIVKHKDEFPVNEGRSWPAVSTNEIKNPYEYFLAYGLPKFTAEYKDEIKKEYPERVTIFKDIFRELLKQRGY